MKYRLDATAETFENIEFFDIPMLFSMFRIDRSSVPRNVYMYEVRHSDYEDADPVEIKSDVLVNFWGTLLSTRPLPMNERGCCYVRTGEDWGFTGESSTLIDYVMEHPPLEKKQAQVR